MKHDVGAQDLVPVPIVPLYIVPSHFLHLIL
jgi:hypothetical protein